VRKARLTEPQWKVLRIFALFPDRARATWVDEADRVIAPVEQPVACPPGAVGIRVHRCGDDGLDLLKGVAVDRTHLNTADAMALRRFWKVPFQRVNPAGLAVGAGEWEPPPKAEVSVSCRMTWDKFKQLKERALREGRTITAVLLQATNEYLERYQ
jgi:hypothetical protein